MARRIRRRELLWAAIAAGLAAWLFYSGWRARQEQRARAAQSLPGPRLVQPVVPGQFDRETYG